VGLGPPSEENRFERAQDRCALSDVPAAVLNVKYVINPWMVGNIQRVSPAEANGQWTALYGLMRSYAEVDLIDPAPDLPDMPFTANGGLVIGDTAVVSNFLLPERKNEEPLFERWFAEQGFAIHRLPNSIAFEGAGDALLDRTTGCVWIKGPCAAQRSTFATYLESRRSRST
jgi:N-dimethylarginine dimethylaminohydrolase